MNNQTASSRKFAGKVATAIALAIAAGTVHAQATTGSIIGEVPAGAGKTVVIENPGTGFSRTLSVDAGGRYAAPNLPLGRYKVTVKDGDKVVDSRENILVTVGTAANVSFTEEVLDAVIVSGLRSSIDVSTTDTRTVITAEELAALPLGRTAEAIALLAPGVVSNSGGYDNGPLGGSLVSFGGSAASENAYYLNGFNTTNAQNSLGGLTLPYGAIDQQEIFTGGYGAQYGRSNGGVINQVGKHGTNDWHFGAQVTWSPDALSAHGPNAYWRDGSIYKPLNHQESDQISYGAYVSGPILQDRLFFFVGAEFVDSTGSRIATIRDTTTPFTDYQYEQTRAYAKLDWRITDDHLLEATVAQDKATTDGKIYRYNYTTFERTTRLLSTAGAPVSEQNNKFGPRLFLGKYTGNFGDSLTVTALYGKQFAPDKLVPIGYDPVPPLINADANTNRQNPAYLTGGVPILSAQTVTSLTDPDREYRKDNLRLNVNWRISSHSINLGIDNQKSEGIDIGSTLSGPGFSWTYGVTADPNGTLTGGLVTNSANADGGVGAPSPGLVDPTFGASGYYVIKNINSSLFSYKARQKAYYLEDQWQATDKLLLSAGLRRDEFTNFTPFGDAYIDVDFIAPRLGFSWDINGDASLKIFGNVGRYYLGLPLSPVGLFTPATTTSTYFTYKGINPDGTPVISQQMGSPVSANSRFGRINQDIRTAVAKGIKGENQDEVILGFTKELSRGWVGGIRGTYRRLNDGIDDINVDSQNFGLVAAARAAGLPSRVVSGTTWYWDLNKTNSAILANPGSDNIYQVVDWNGALREVKVPNDLTGFPEFKRDYWAVEFNAERPFNGKWYAKVNYVLSHSFGTTEGQLRSDLWRTGGSLGSYQGQAAVSTTQSWDHPALMEYMSGDQSNDHRHSLKFFGLYKLTEEFGVSANLSLISGAPRPCLGNYYGDNYAPTNHDPAGYGGSTITGGPYHFCYNAVAAASAVANPTIPIADPSPPGSHGHLGWVKSLDLGVSYQPTFTENKLTVNLNVFNVFGWHTATNIYPFSMLPDQSINKLWNQPVAFQAPRSTRLSVSYDF